MKRILALVAVASMAVTVAGPAPAGDAQGEVTEIIIKVETPEGPRWYSLGADLSTIDIRKGTTVRFNYADDTIESIEVEEVAPGDPPAETQ
jgi:hypothetical protein